MKILSIGTIFSLFYGFIYAKNLLNDFEDTGDDFLISKLRSFRLREEELDFVHERIRDSFSGLSKSDSSDSQHETFQGDFATGSSYIDDSESLPELNVALENDASADNLAFSADDHTLDGFLQEIHSYADPDELE